MKLLTFSNYFLFIGITNWI